VPGRSDPEVYRDLATIWLHRAELLPDGLERNICLILSEGYARLAALLDKRG
jgi:hypothetical protein